MPDNGEKELLARASTGDTAAFRTLFDTHHEALFRLAYHLCGSTPSAEDVVQECFLRVVRHPGRFDARRASLRQYLYGVVRNLLRQRWQAEGREAPLEDVDLPVEPVICADVTEAVQAAVSMLPVAQREAIVLFEFEGLSLEEVAAVSGCDTGTVKSRLWRARQRLRQALAPYGKGVSHESAER